MSRRKKSRALQRVEYAAYRFFAGIVQRLSDESAHRWGTRFGALAGKVLRRRDRVAMTNLRLAFPEKSDAERQAILRECWRHFGREIVSYIRIQSLSLDAIAERCPFHNVALLEEAISRGKGVLLISAHYGSWEVGGVAIMSLVKNVRTVVRRLDNEYLERDLARLRERTGVELIDRRRAARALTKALQENAAVILLPDQAVLPREGVLAPFLGHPAWTTPVPAKLALRHASTVVFTFCIPDGFRHRLEFDEAIRVDQLAEGERDPVALTKRINDVISRRIASRPELWLWMHDRWKGTGESEVGNG
jgi:KDO2-lipid IV(A) lauroyltransferase